MNPVRWLAVKLSSYAAGKPAPRRGMLAFVSEYLAGLLWTFDTTWQSLIKKGYGQNAVIYACTRILCQGIAEARLTAYDSEDRAERQELPRDHPLRLLLKHPNELLTEYETIELITIHVSVVGRSVWWKERSNSGQIIGIWPMRPDRVTPIYSTSDAAGEKVLWGYSYLPPNEGSAVALPRRDCMSFNFPDPDGESGGMVEGFGPLSALSRQIAADNTATDHVGNLLANYAQPGIALEMEDSPTPEEAAIIKAKFRQEFGGSRIGVPAIVGAGTKITPLGFSLRDLEFPGLRANAEARICAAMGVPAILAGVYVGLHESNQRATTKELREYFTETTLAAYWRRYADQFTLELAVEFGEGLVVEFDTAEVKALAGQFAEKLAPWATAQEKGQITVNEYRGKLGLDPLPPEVGDVLYVSNTVTAVPATPEARAYYDNQQAEQAKQQAATQAALEKQQQADQGQLPSNGHTQLPPGEQPKQLQAGANGKSAAIKSVDPRDAAEQQLRKALQALFAKLASDIAAKIEAGEPIDDALLSAAFAQVIEPQLVEAATAEGIRIAAEIGVQWDPAITNLQASAWAHDYTFSLVKDMTDTTRKVLQSAISKLHATPGMTRAELEGLIEPAFGSARASVIATTEVSRSYAQSMNQYQQGLADAGVAMSRRWETQADERVCPICGPLNRKMEKEWAGSFPDGPPAHPSCRCALSLTAVEA